MCAFWLRPRPLSSNWTYLGRAGGSWQFQFAAPNSQKISYDKSAAGRTRGCGLPAGRLHAVCRVGRGTHNGPRPAAGRFNEETPAESLSCRSPLGGCVPRPIRKQQEFLGTALEAFLNRFWDHFGQGWPCRRPNRTLFGRWLGRRVWSAAGLRGNIWAGHTQFSQPRWWWSLSTPPGVFGGHWGGLGGLV